MVYPNVKRCADCKWSVPNKDRWDLRCTHPLVNAADPYFLSYTLETIGTDCTHQRENKSWKAKCGLKGKLFEPRNDLLKAV